MKRLALTLLLLGASCAGIALPDRAQAVATTKVSVTSTAWVDLGVGPLQLNSGGTQIYYAIADTTPPLPAVGFAVSTDTNQVVNTATHVWVIAATPNVASVIVAPVAGTSGSGGTFTWPGSATVTSYGVAPTGTVPAVNTFCTNCVAGGGGATGWTPDYIYSTPLAVTNASAVTPLPVTTVGAVIKVYNRGPSQAYYTVGTSGAVATTAMAQIAPQSWDSFVVKAGQTHLAAITNISTQTATLNIESGTGSPNGTGGPVNPAIYPPGNTVTFTETISGVDNGSHALALPVTPVGTASTLASVTVSGSPSGVPIPVSGSFGVTVGGFTPSSTNTRMTPITVGLTDTSGPLPAGAPVEVVVDNTDAVNPVYCNVNGVAATLADKKIFANSWFAFTIPIGQTTLHCIATGGTAIVNGLAGSGLATGGGGGGSSSGTGGGGGGATGNVVVTNDSTQPIPTYPSNITPTKVTPSGPFAVTLVGQVYGTKTVPISIPSSNVPTSVVIQAGSPGLLTYVTLLAISGDATSTLSLKEGTQTTTPCDTYTGPGTGVLTGTVPMNGSLQGANGGASPAIQTQVSGDDICAVVTTLKAYGGWMMVSQR